jgi:hypothetical protein
MTTRRGLGRLLLASAAGLAACGGLAAENLGSVDGAAQAEGGDSSHEAAADAATGDTSSPDAPSGDVASADAPFEEGVFEGSGDPGDFPDATITTFACGPKTCKSPSQYCYLYSAGPPPPPEEGGFPGTAKCIAVPAACALAPTCACIEKLPHPCGSCADDGGELTISCSMP